MRVNRFAEGLVVFCAVIAVSSAAVAAPCDDVVGDTLAELRVGAGDTWSDAKEELARRAAGAACVKILSNRYSSAGTDSIESSVLATEAAIDSSVDGQSASRGDETAAESSEESDDGSWTFGGLKMRSLSGAPSQKPYERARSKKSDE